MELKIGLTGRADALVTSDKTAAACGSGSLPVFGTPFLLALMEEATCNSLEGRLEDGRSSVGVSMEVQHSAASPVGIKVWAESELTKIDGKMLTFTVTAYDEAGVIGTASITRCIIRSESFVARCNAKLISSK
ncbi:MAG: thioesterase family protein [Oscillospiraceae bacterium]|nr:thioesterase family protein [Oscillospiraceae bacterium]